MEVGPITVGVIYGALARKTGNISSRNALPVGLSEAWELSHKDLTWLEDSLEAYCKEKVESVSI